MSEDWIAVAADVKKALADVGIIATIKRKGLAHGPDYAPYYDPDTEHTFTVILGSFSNRERADTAILATDTKIMASVGDVVPAVSDKITVRGVDYQVYGVDPLKPGGDVLMHKIWARA